MLQVLLDCPEILLLTTSEATRHSSYPPAVIHCLYQALGVTFPDSGSGHAWTEAAVDEAWSQVSQPLQPVKQLQERLL